MASMTGYQLYEEAYKYVGTEAYNGKEYFKYSLSETNYILAPTRNITKVTPPFDDYYRCHKGKIFPFSGDELDSLYGFTSVPENKILMKRRTDIGTNANGKDCVDLGLTSGTLWATMNVGATSESDYGSYFQWGDTVDKRAADCSWTSYKYGDGDNFSKYNTGFNNIGGTIDNKTTLDLEDDAARVNMGGDWRMPSPALIEELVSETNSEWVNNYNGTGKNGRKFTSKINGNSIFFPASGLRSDSSFVDQGDFGRVWSSSLDALDPIGARDLDFGSGSAYVALNYPRSYGFPARGVL